MLKPREDCRLINGTLNKLERDWRKNKNLLTLYWQASVVGERAAARQAEGRTCIPVPVPREHVSGRGRIYGTDKGLYPEHMGLDHGRAEEVRC